MAQVAFLRRDDAVVVAVATDLDTANVQRAAGDTVRGHLVLSDAPEQIERIGDARGIVGQTLVGYGATRPRTTLLGLEFPANALAPAGRTRFAITVPASLADLAPGAYAISDPIVLRAPSDNGFLPNDMEGALPHMATAQTFERERIGVYLETYGLLPSDTVEMAVWVERYTPQGVLRQLGNALGVTTDLNTPAAVSWVGPQTSGAVQRMSGTIPILGRSVVLDLSQLTPGEYWLDVAVAKPGRETVRGRRSIVIQ
jgi:hypothetical protein